MNTKLFERSKIMRFDDKAFFNTSLGFEFHWYHSPHHVYSGEYILNKNHLKCNVIDGSIVNGLREPIYLSFVLDKMSGFRVFCEPATFRKRNKSVLITITVFLKDDDHKEVSLNGETVTFALQINKF